MNSQSDKIQKLLNSKAALSPFSSAEIRKVEAEGGCGVIGLASTERLPGRHLLSALYQMRNRGNGKGGGIAAVGLSAQHLGTTQAILDNNYLLAIAYLDKQCQVEVERDYIHPLFEIDHMHGMPHVEDFKGIPGIDILPPEVCLYFVRVKSSAYEVFRDQHNLASLSQSAIEDEMVYQNSYRLNLAFYASIGEKRAFVLSHAKNLLVLKMVGYGDDVIRYYQLEEFPAHVWIGHHRYPTKGRVWHPGGAHPFVGLNEALVHNGDFANYFSMCEYLAQRNIHPLFLTDTEAAALIFDLFARNYNYPLEYVIEALAPTTERDFALLSQEKQVIYEMIQKTHIHGSPDGPWFFLIAQSLIENATPFYRLIGITDTSMLRPQVFALQKGEVSIGLAASEKQAIDAALKSLAEEDGRFWPCADYYWNARGGSYTDGGAFIFTVQPQPNGKATLTCTDKFGRAIYKRQEKPYADFKAILGSRFPTQAFIDLPSDKLFAWVKQKSFEWTYEQMMEFLAALNQNAVDDYHIQRAIEVTSKLIDYAGSTQYMRQSCLQALFHQSLSDLIETIARQPTFSYAYLNFKSERPYPLIDTQTLIIDARGFPAEGENSLALEIVKMVKRGFKRFMIVHCQGQRFIGNGLGAGSQGIRIDVYGSSGDYLASGIDGATIFVHGSAQDQLAQIMKEGTLVVHGDIGQTFMYGAKGGKAFVRGNAAGRPLINAVGKPRVVINGTCLDYLAESFMAGDPLKGGGFVIINGILLNEEGGITELDTPYAGSNLFSLASGGAIYLRDPGRKVGEEQLNGGEFQEMTNHDWELILLYLEENFRLFNIPIARLLEYEGKTLEFKDVYRKIGPLHVRILQEEEAWVRGKGRSP